MPKAKTTKSKVATPKTKKLTTSKKQPSKLNSFAVKLNPDTPRKKLMSFVLVFALIGGSVYAYQTFATSKIETKLFTARHVLGMGSIDTRAKDTETTGAKKDKQVIEMRNGSSFKILDGLRPRSVGYKYAQACVDFRPKHRASSQNAGKLSLSFYDEVNGLIGKKGTIAIYPRDKKTTNTTYCTTRSPIKYNQNGASEPLNVRVSADGIAKDSIYVGNVRILLYK